MTTEPDLIAGLGCRGRLPQEPQPWARRPGETRQAFAAFVRYRDLGPKRSIDKAFRASLAVQDGGKATAPRFWEKWSAQHEWVSRSAAYDEHLQAVEQAAREKAAAEDAAKWEARRAAIREEEFESAGRLLAAAADMLCFPLERVIVAENGASVTIEPARWRFADAARFIVVASGLRRHALGMGTDKAIVEAEVERELEALLDTAKAVLPVEWFEALLLALAAKAP